MPLHFPSNITSFRHPGASSRTRAMHNSVLHSNLFQKGSAASAPGLTNQVKVANSADLHCRRPIQLHLESVLLHLCTLFFICRLPTITAQYTKAHFALTELKEAGIGRKGVWSVSMIMNYRKRNLIKDCKYSLEGTMEITDKRYRNLARLRPNAFIQPFLDVRHELFPPSSSE